MASAMTIVMRQGAFAIGVAVLGAVNHFTGAVVFLWYALFDSFDCRTTWDACGTSLSAIVHGGAEVFSVVIIAKGEQSRFQPLFGWHDGHHLSVHKALRAHHQPPILAEGIEHQGLALHPAGQMQGSAGKSRRSRPEVEGFQPVVTKPTAGKVQQQSRGQGPCTTRPG